MTAAGWWGAGGGAKSSVNPLSTHLSLQSLALALTELADKEVLQKREDGVPLCPNGAF